MGFDQLGEQPAGSLPALEKLKQPLWLPASPAGFQRGAAGLSNRFFAPFALHNFMLSDLGPIKKLLRQSLLGRTPLTYKPSSQHLQCLRGRNALESLTVEGVELPQHDGFVG